MIISGSFFGNILIRHMYSYKKNSIEEKPYACILMVASLPSPGNRTRARGHADDEFLKTLKIEHFQALLGYMYMNQRQDPYILVYYKLRCMLQMTKANCIMFHGLLHTFHLFHTIQTYETF